jgi:hypothetical protein
VKERFRGAAPLSHPLLWNALRRTIVVAGSPSAEWFAISIGAVRIFSDASQELARLYLVDEIAEPSRDRLKNGRCFVAIAGFLLFIPEIVHQLAIEIVHFEG